jgi:hypothetical protein
VRRARGASAVEMLIAMPILLIVGMGALQLALIFHARQAIQHATLEAARAGSVGHAGAGAMHQGFARGLMPYLYGASGTTELMANTARALVHVQSGQLQGWIRIERLSPTPESFADWAVAATGPRGETLAHLREIPNDNLASRILRQQPLSGTSGTRGGEPIGRTSGQTLADANLLKVHVTYGVPASVPLVGRMIAWTLRTWNGCTAAQARRYGALELSAPSRSWWADPTMCLFYGFDERQTPRLPVTAVSTIRMQSAARP